MSGFYAIASGRGNAFSADMRWVGRSLWKLPSLLPLLLCFLAGAGGAAARAAGPVVGAVAPFPEDPAWRWFCAGVRERLDAHWGADGYEWREQQTTSAGPSAQEAALTTLLAKGSLDALFLCPDPEARYDRVQRVLRLDGTTVFTFGRKWSGASGEFVIWHGTVDPAEAWGWVQTVVFDLMRREGAALVLGADAPGDPPWQMRPFPNVDRRPATGAWELQWEAAGDLGQVNGWILLDERVLFDLGGLAQRREVGPIVAASPHPVVLSRLEAGQLDALVVPDYAGLGSRAAEELWRLEEGGAKADETVVQRYPLVLTPDNVDRWVRLWQRYAE